LRPEVPASDSLKRTLFAKTVEKREKSNMFAEDNDCANTTGDKDRERKHTANTIILSDENINRDQIV
jgi:hypothetical protein